MPGELRGRGGSVDGERGEEIRDLADVGQRHGRDLRVVADEPPRRCALVPPRVGAQDDAQPERVLQREPTQFSRGVQSQERVPGPEGALKLRVRVALRRHGSNVRSQKRRAAARKPEARIRVADYP